jgi:hypothetical protein
LVNFSLRKSSTSCGLRDLLLVVGEIVLCDLLADLGGGDLLLELLALLVRHISL